MSHAQVKALEYKTDAELVELARDRDKDAFGTLARRYEPAARGFAARLTNDPDLACELVQEAWLQAYLSLEHLRDASRFKSWLCGILLNLRRDHLRTKRPLLTLDDLQGGDRLEQPFAASPQEDVQARELHEAVKEALQALSPAHRQVLTMFYFDGLAVSEISSHLGISETAAKVRLHRARGRLRERLRECHPELTPRTGRKKMIRVSIADVRIRGPAGAGEPAHHVVLLKDEAGERVIPIWVGPQEGQAIAAGIQKFATPRPLTLDFFANLLRAIDAHIEEVRIEALKSETFYAVVKVRVGGTLREVDARPSDALAIAVRTGSPVFATEEVMKTAGIAIPAGSGNLMPQEGIKGIVGELDKQLKQLWKPAAQLPAEGARRLTDELIRDVFKSKRDGV